MSRERKQLGAQGEEIAVDFLKKNYYKIIFRNYRCRFGEIDIIARKKNVLSFIEVKTRDSERYGAPEEAVIPSKQRTISRVALEFIQRYRLEDRAARFDVITVMFTQGSYRVDIIENAFDLAL